VLALGVVIFAVSAVLTVQQGWITPWYAVLAVPLTLLIARFPLLLDRHVGAIEIGFEACVLVLLACTAEPAVALSMWSMGVVLSQAVNGKRLAAKLFNMGLGVAAGAFALLIIVSLRGPAVSTVREVVAVGLGCAGYFAFDFIVSAVSVCLEERTPFLAQIAQPDALIAASCFIAVDSLGYLAALVIRSQPKWAIFLLLVPLTTMLVAARSVTRGRENARRLTVLFATSSELHQLHTVDEMLETLLTGARAVLRVKHTAVRDDRPGPHEVGAMFHDGERERWLVTRGLNRARSNIAGDRQSLKALAAVAEEAFSRLRMTNEMTHLARHDTLTGLPNRSLFLDRLDHALRVRRRRHSRLAVLFCDLDGFKRVNDRLGHAAGDSLLIEVAGRLTSRLRDSDTVARLGGDEFAILIEDVAEGAEVNVSCDRILEALRERITVLGHRVSVSTSIGVAFSETGDTADALLRNADMAMYQAKGLGRDRFAVYEPVLGHARVQKLELVEALRLAVENSDLTLVYQPVLDLRTREIAGVEALARWTVDGRDIPPDVFIAAAEESGLVVPLGELVLKLAAADAPMLREVFGEGMRLGVNISAQELSAKGFVHNVDLARSEMGDIELMLEVTERDFVSNDPCALAAMTRLSQSGVVFAVDDFGVGFSSIGYLQQLPVEVLKTDRSFSMAIDTDERACGLLRSMVSMGKALGLDVLVEGVERESQVVHLLDHVGATHAQGYLLHQPMTLTNLAATLVRAPTVV
jgi:diguanylate cyclase (GGDEF)-like protein